MFKDNEKPVVIVWESKEESADVKAVYVFDDRDSAANYFGDMVDSGVPCTLMVGTVNPEPIEVQRRLL